MFDFMDKHPMLMLGLFLAAFLLYSLIKYLYDKQKGKNSEERRRVLEILKAVIPVEESYVPVYAYWTEHYGKSSKSWYYAMGITDEKLYVVPLHIAGKVIGYDKSFVIHKNSLGKVDSGKAGGTVRYVKLYDQDQKEFLKFEVNEVNTKMDKTMPFNIVQVEDFRAFAKKLDEWKSL